MPSTTHPTRERILDAGSEHFRRQGYNGTGVKQIVTTAGAPFASLYHFFPGGKDELCEHVIRWSGAIYGQLIDAIIDPAPDIVTGIRAFFRGAADTLVETDYADACPIAVISLEVSSTNDTLRTACDDVFEGWIDAAAARCRAAGIPKKRSRELAIFAVCALEGAFILSRASRTPEAVLVAGEFVTEAFRTSLPSRRKR